MKTPMTYGKSSSGHYAVALYRKTHGTWDAVESVGDFYRIIDFDDVPECDWDRVDALEEQITSGKSLSHAEIMQVEYYDRLTPEQRREYREGTIGISLAVAEEMDWIDTGHKARCLS